MGCYHVSDDQTYVKGITMRKFYRKDDLPLNNVRFDNGDIMTINSEYVQGEPRFGYYRPTKAGFKLEREFYRKKAAHQYNWVKQQPGFEQRTIKSTEYNSTIENNEVKTTKKVTHETIVVKHPDDVVGSVSDRVIENDNVIDLFRGRA
jgi:hypothetical protein